jgi:hypothetical protein
MMGWNNRTRTVAELHLNAAGRHVRAAFAGRGDEGQREPPEMAAVAGPDRRVRTHAAAWASHPIYVDVAQPRSDRYLAAQIWAYVLYMMVRLIVIPGLQLPVVAPPKATDHSLDEMNAWSDKRPRPSVRPSYATACLVSLSVGRPYSTITSVERKKSLF